VAGGHGFVNVLFSLTEPRFMPEGRDYRQPRADPAVTRWSALSAANGVCIVILVIILYVAWHGPGR